MVHLASPDLRQPGVTMPADRADKRERLHFSAGIETFILKTLVRLGMRHFFRNAELDCSHL